MAQSIGKRILRGLQEFNEALENDDQLAKKLTGREVVLDLKPTRYTAKRVKETRQLLEVSQLVFAQFLGVKVSTLQKWEQGRQQPEAIAGRFLDEIRLNPDYWRDRLRKSLRIKAAS
ncbi:MAG: helix-turn-helix domain-containing protein [Pirellulales bacterium]|nr:helix-turn-helix domain-containing protein [Pirellulales bacterium]